MISQLRYHRIHVIRRRVMFCHITVRFRVLNDVIHYIEGIKESEVTICIRGLQVLDHDLQG